MRRVPGVSAMSGLLARLRSLWRGARRRAELESEMQEEFRNHLELRTEDLIRRGVRPGEAARQARIEFGHIESHRQDARASRGLRLFDEVRFSWLDVKLAVRILAKYPGLTVVGGLAMAFAICIGAGTFQFIGQMVDPSLPLADGDRVIGLRYWDRATNRAAFPLSDDLRMWREQFRTVQDIGGFRTAERNLIVDGEAGEPLQVARISAAGFRVAGVPPVVGRYLVESDEEPGSDPVVVLGHGVWQTRFRGDPDVAGRTVRLGELRATVVGVMPQGFAFPQDHEIWTALPRQESGDTEAAGPLRVFGRLTGGATLEEAQAEAIALAARAARKDTQRHEHLTAQVLPYIESLTSARISLLVRAMVYQLNVLAALFLILVSANVALLMFARAATREREILVRNALGASRRRIVTQLFVEALALGSVAAVLGLAATGPGLQWVMGTIREMGGRIPFWWDDAVDPMTMIYAVLLTLLGSVVAGVVPALKITGPGMHARLRQVGAGAGGLRIGGIWTGIIVTQIAATVVFTGVAFVLARQASRMASVETHFPAEQYLGVRIEMDRERLHDGDDTTSASFLRRYASSVRELQQRLALHPAVAGVTVSERLPIKARALALIELDEGGAAEVDTSRPEYVVYADAVDPDFFNVLQIPLLAGRRFDSRDLEYRVSSTVVVNASFVDEVLGGRSAVGRRVRYVNRDPDSETGAWHEIVGVVGDLVADRTQSLDLQDPPRGRIYHPMEASSAANYPVHIVVHARGSPAELTPMLHALTESVDPALRLHEPLTLDKANSDLASGWRLYAILIITVSATALFLALAGIYAVLSFTVSRRRREIGIRVALGANRTRVMSNIFRDPLTQIGAGVAVGCVLLGTLIWIVIDGRARLADGALLVALGVAMLGFCGIACITPTVRALRIQPAEALGTEE